MTVTSPPLATPTFRVDSPVEEEIAGFRADRSKPNHSQLVSSVAQKWKGRLGRSKSRPEVYKSEDRSSIEEGELDVFRKLASSMVTRQNSMEGSKSSSPTASKTEDLLAIWKTKVREVGKKTGNESNGITSPTEKRQAVTNKWRSVRQKVMEISKNDSVAREEAFSRKLSMQLANKPSNQEPSVTEPSSFLATISNRPSQLAARMSSESADSATTTQVKPSPLMSNYRRNSDEDSKSRTNWQKAVLKTRAVNRFSAPSDQNTAGSREDVSSLRRGSLPMPVLDKSPSRTSLLSSDSYKGSKKRERSGSLNLTANRKNGKTS